VSKLTKAAEILPPPAYLRVRPICRKQSASISQPCYIVEAADSSTNWKSSGTANVNMYEMYLNLTRCNLVAFVNCFFHCSSRSKINARHPTPSVNDEGFIFLLAIYY